LHGETLDGLLDVADRVANPIAQDMGEQGEQLGIAVAADLLAPLADERARLATGPVAVEHPPACLEQGLLDRISVSIMAVLFLKRTEVSLFFYNLGCSQFREHLVLILAITQWQILATT
jgi:hypothetical protein